MTHRGRSRFRQHHRSHPQRGAHRLSPPTPSPVTKVPPKLAPGQVHPTASSERFSPPDNQRISSLSRLRSTLLSPILKTTPNLAPGQVHPTASSERFPVPDNQRISSVPRLRSTLLSPILKSTPNFPPARFTPQPGSPPARFWPGGVDSKQRTLPPPDNQRISSLPRLRSTLLSPILKNHTLMSPTRFAPGNQANTLVAQAGDGDKKSRAWELLGLRAAETRMFVSSTRRSGTISASCSPSWPL